MCIFRFGKMFTNALLALVLIIPTSALSANETCGAPRRFEGKVFLVTGASSGIGEVVAKHLAADGAHVVLAARRVEKLKILKELITSDGGAASVLALDVLDHKKVLEGVSSIVEQYGRLDGAFNNAGGGEATGTVAEIPMGKFKKGFELNFYGTYHCIKAEMQVMIKQGVGSIVNNLSALGKAAMAQQHAYMAAKRALFAIQDAAALEGAPVGVRINSVSPGFTRPSESLDNFLESNPGMEKLFQNPQGEIVPATAVYQSVAFLFDDRLSKSITGTDIPVAGGHHVHEIILNL